MPNQDWCIVVTHRFWFRDMKIPTYIVFIWNNCGPAIHVVPLNQNIADSDQLTIDWQSHLCCGPPPENNAYFRFSYEQVIKRISSDNFSSELRHIPFILTCLRSPSICRSTIMARTMVLSNTHWSHIENSGISSCFIPDFRSV